MFMSTAGKILIIDDKLEEDAKPLMRALSKNSLPYLYYEGLLKYMPKKPLCGIRFIFLDLDLKGVPKATGTDKIKNMASYAAHVVVKLISKNNGPFFILFWSKHSTESGIVDLILNNCATKELYPVSFLDIDKPSCKNKKGQFDISLITKNIEAKISSIGSFMLYVAWENIINASVNKQIFELFDCFHTKDNWNGKNELLFYVLYKTYSEGYNTNNDGNKIRNLYKILSRSLVSKIEIETQRIKDHYLNFYKSESIPKEFFDKYYSSSKEVLNIYCINEEGNKYVLKKDVSKKKMNEGTDVIHTKLNEIIGGIQTIARLNTSLFLADCVQETPASGFVYFENNKDILNDLKTYNKIDKTCRLCKIILTPECDIAQNKTFVSFKKKNSHKVHRIVYGLLFPIANTNDYEDKNKSVEFLIGPIWHNKSTHLLIVNFATITFQDESKIKSKPIFSLRRDLMFDLQSKAANHVNRLGNFQLK